MLSRMSYISRQTFRFLTFQSLEIEGKRDLLHLAIAGIVFAWIAGLGRYWDHPSAHIWQYMGLGSVIYIFVLAALIWILALPLRPERWSYLSVLTFVGLTSPLAWLYAIPVERFVPISTAVTANVLFLAIVAMWRVALYVYFLRVIAKLSGAKVFVLTLLPLTGIIFALAALNLEHAVFEIMAGLETERTESEVIHDGVYFFVLALGVVSVFAAPILFLLYLWLFIREGLKSRLSKK